MEKSLDCPSRERGASTASVRQAPPIRKSLPSFTPTTGTVERRFSTNHETPFRLSETFALNEILAIHARGMLGALIATKAGDGRPIQPGADQLLDLLHILPEGTIDEQATALADHTANRKLSGFHAYFTHLPLRLAARAARRRDLPYGFSTHAKDARKIDPVELRSLASGASCAVGCNSDVARQMSGNGIEVDVIPHGVDTSRFHPRPAPDEPPIRLLAVGRFVAKKGFEVLIEALSKVRVPFQMRFVGTGDGRESWKVAIDRNGLADHNELCGMRTHSDLPAEYAKAHIVVVPSVVDETGDRDGLPNVVLEAMSCGRPIVASDVGAIGDAVIPGETGLLVPPGDSAALAAALDDLSRQPDHRANFGRNARHRIESRWTLPTCTDRLCDFLEATYA